MKKRLYLVRHGQTMFNRQYRMQGWCDSPLTELGKRQAAFVRDWLSRNDVRLDAACCSTSERCSDTLEIISDMPYERLKGLKEINFGELEGATQWLSARNMKKDWATYYLAFGGECATDVGRRMRETLEHVMSDPSSKCVLAVSHGACSASFMEEIGADKNLFPGLLTNGCIFVLDFDDETRTFDLIEYVPNPVVE